MQRTLITLAAGLVLIAGTAMAQSSGGSMSSSSSGAAMSKSSTATTGKTRHHRRHRVSHKNAMTSGSTSSGTNK
ncbi:MAG: hypothetical protein ACREFW_06675 [Rhizomicrobium sp.]